MPTNSPTPGHPLVGTTHLYQGGESGAVAGDRGPALCNGARVEIRAVFTDWNGIPGLDMLYVYSPQTGAHTHITPADLGLPALPTPSTGAV